MSYHRIPIAISSCLLGDAVRYDGGHKKNDFIIHGLGRYFEYHGFCPEINIGLGVPRPKIYLTEVLGRVRCLSSIDATRDLTLRLENAAHQQKSWLDGMCGYILKKNSPSCGKADVSIETADDRVLVDSGIFAATVRANNPLLPLVQEDELGDEHSSQPFLQSVLAYHHWRQLDLQTHSRQSLTQYHVWMARLSSNLSRQTLYIELAEQIQQSPETDMEKFSQAYIRQIMRLLHDTPPPDQVLLTPEKFARLSSVPVAV